MVSNTTIETINYIKDIEFEYNIKILTLASLVVFSILCIWYFENRFQINTLAQYYLKMVLTKSSWTFFIASPLWIGFLARTVQYDIILRFLMFIYGLAFSVGFILAFAYGGEKIYNFFTGRSFHDKRHKYK